MKKLSLLGLMIIISFSVWGQTNSFPETGNVSIYQSGTSPRTYDVHNSDNLLVSRFEVTSDKTGQLWLKDARGNIRVLLRSNSSPSYIMGNLGIGTDNPLAKLHIKNGDNSYGTILAQASEKGFQLYSKTLTTQPINVESFRIGLKYNDNENNGYISFYRGASVNGGYLGFATNGTERLLINGSGNIGIGTNSPSSKLEIRQSTLDQGLIITEPNNSQTIKLHLANNSAGQYGYFYLGGNTALRGNGQPSYFDGNVGIGTTTPDYKLDVCGTIRAKEVKVEEFTCLNASFDGTLAANNITVKANGNTADFVFEDSYQLKDLAEVETFIKANKHLPDIPSAAQMEEQGVNLAEMNKLLLQKVEELTLYSIGLEKARKKEKGERKKLEERLERLEEFLLKDKPE